MREARWLLAGMCAVLTASPALGVNYYVISDFSKIRAGAPSNAYLYASAAEGDTVYNALSGPTGVDARITKVASIYANPDDQVGTVVMTPADYQAAGGGTNLTPFYGFSISGDYLQFGDSITDEIWRVNKTTGAVAKYVSKAQIQAFTLASNVSLLTSTTTNPFNGEMIFYESTSNSILTSAGEGVAQYFLTSTALKNSAAGTDLVAGGLTLDAAGNFYWGSNPSSTNPSTTTGTKKGIFQKAPDGTVVQILAQDTITALTGKTGVSWKDIFAGPDGLIYFQDNTSANIMRFNPANPAGTLETYISSTELLQGPANGTNVYQLTWARGGLAFNVHSTTGARGFYGVLPEPAMLSLLSLGLPLVMRRRTR